MAASEKLLKLRERFRGSALVDVRVKVVWSPKIPASIVAAALPNTLCVEG
jgi:hypothetical protein